MYRPAERLADIAPFHVVELLTRARQLEAQGRDIIHMEVGEPDFPTPEPIARAGQAAIAAGHARYTPALGLPELRQAIAGFYRTRYGLDVPTERVVVTSGASGALNLAFACLANPGSQWLLTDPGYPCNRHIIRTYEGIPVSIPVGPESQFQLTPALVDQYWRADTAGVLLASPANPTGTLLSHADMAALWQTIQARNGHFLVDEIYHGLTYEGEAPSAAAISEQIWVLQSFSKYFQMTGWRLGWMLVPPQAVRDIEKLAQNLTLCPPTPAQYAALAAFEPETLALLETRREAFRARRDVLAPALENLGFRLAAPAQGAFYLYCDCSALTDDSFSFARALLEEAGVAATPGLDFGAHQPERHIRFAYTTDVARLEEAVRRIARFLGCA